MKSKDRIKEEIGLYKLLMTLDFASFTSIVSWFWNNSHLFEIFIKSIIIFSIFILVFVGLALFAITKAKIKELDL